MGFDWATFHALLQSSMWTRGLWKGSTNNLSRSGRPVKPCVSPGDTSEAESDATSVARVPVKSLGPGVKGGKVKTARKMRNDAGVFCAGLFLTWIYGFNWQVLEENAESPQHHLQPGDCSMLCDGLDWLMGSLFIFYLFPHSSSSVEQGPFNFSNLALDGRNSLLPCGSDTKKTI